MSQLFTSGGQRIGVSASASVLPMNTQEPSPLGWTGWISLQAKGLSRVFSNSTVQKHPFFGAQLSLWSTRTYVIYTHLRDGQFPALSVSKASEASVTAALRCELVSPKGTQEGPSDFSLSHQGAPRETRCENRGRNTGP